MLGQGSKNDCGSRDFRLSSPKIWCQHTLLWDKLKLSNIMVKHVKYDLHIKKNLKNLSHSYKMTASSAWIYYYWWTWFNHIFDTIFFFFVSLLLPLADVSISSGMKSPKGNKRSSSQLESANIYEAFNRKKVSEWVRAYCSFWEKRTEP